MGNTPIIVPLWPDGAPGSEDWTQQEEEAAIHEGIKVVRNVAQPSLTVYLPDPEVATGTAAVVCPGGAFHMLSIDMEGHDVAAWLAGKGIAAAVLKYRLIYTGDDFPEVVGRHLEDPDEMIRLFDPLKPMLLADGQQAIRLLRSRASEWHINPDRIGMIGFSAGGTVTVNVALEHDAESRPDFAGAIYSAWTNDVPVPRDAPPLFILCAADDEMASPISLQLFSAWRAAGHPAELHIYAQGGHGFGMRTLGNPSDRWIERFHEWLGAQNLLLTHRTRR